MTPADLFDDAKEAIGTCDQSKYFAKLTDAIQLLANKGDWDLLTGYVDICACGDKSNTFTLPREVDTPLALNINGRPAYFRNKWYEFHLNGMGSCQPTPYTWDDVGDVVTFLDPIQPSILLLLADLKTDSKATVRVYGFDENDKWVRWQQPDGTWIDGIDINARLMDDFRRGIVVPDQQIVFSRNFSMHPLTELHLVNHQLVTGQPVVLSLSAAPLPTPLVVGQVYYVRKIDDDTIALATTQYGALTNTDIVVMTSAANTSQLGLRDTRTMRVLTQFTSASNLGFQQGTIVVLTATTMPDPLLSGQEYFAHLIDEKNFTVHETVDEAINNTNPIDVITPGLNVVASARQTLLPVTIMNFPGPHNFYQGDAVTVTNSTGDFPSPLLPGITYYVKYLTSTSVSLHTTIADAASGANPIVLTSSGSGTTSLVKKMPATASLGSVSNISSAGHNLTINSYPAPVSTATRARVAATSTATITTSAAHHLNTGDYVKITGMSDVSYNDNHAQVTVTGANSFEYSNIGLDEASTPDVAGTVTIIPASGDYVSFTTTGGFPDPITQGTVYRAEPPMSADTFTLYDTAPNVVDITTPGYGQLFLVLSRSFGIGFNNQWRTNATKLTTGDVVRVFSTGTLPGCVPAIDSVTDYYARKVDDQTIELYDTYAHAIAFPATTGRITVTSVGSGDVYLVLNRNVTAIPSSNEMALSSIEYLQDGATVRLSTDGTLPAPLAINTDYKLVLDAPLIKLQTMAGADITLANMGSGNHSLYVNRTVSVQLSTHVDVLNNNYDDGVAVTVQSSQTLPSPLVNNEVIYLRRIDNDSVEFYDTQAHALNKPSTTGRIVLTNTGSGTHIMYQIVNNVKFKKITRITKPVTQGFLYLYAYDYARDLAMSPIGMYHPEDVEPRFRRIQIKECCSWIRMRFRRRLFKIGSMQDFIPLKSKMAVIMMLKAIKMMESDFVEKAKEYEDTAARLLKEEQMASAGPDVVSVQFNDAIWTNPDEQNMDTNNWM